MFAPNDGYYILIKPSGEIEMVRSAPPRTRYSAVIVLKVTSDGALRVLKNQLAYYVAQLKGGSNG